MNKNFEELDIGDIQIGLKKQFKIVLTESMLEIFANLSGDYNPLHMNEQYASTTEFKKRVCHGMMLATFFSKLIGMHIPGKQALLLSQSLKFHSPSFINDEILVEGEVIKKSDATRIITLKTSIFNDSGDHLVEGEAKILVRK